MGFKEEIRRASHHANRSVTSMHAAQAAKNLISIESLAANFVSSHVKAYCLGIATQYVEGKLASDSPTLNTPDSGKEVISPLSDNQLPRLMPSADSGFAAVVMADVSGYSKLSSKLAEKGPVGAELLGKAMKGYLDQIIDIILQHGGDIVKFAGDAVIIYWKIPKTATQIDEDSDEEPENAAPGRTNNALEQMKGDIVSKASMCCLELLKKLGTFNIDIPDCDIKVLKIHLGIGAGLIYDVHVGHGQRWEHFICGDGVNQLATVLDLAKSGELALSHQALKFLSTVIDINSVTIGNYDKRCIILTGLEHAKRKDGAPTSNNAHQNKRDSSNIKLLHPGDILKHNRITYVTSELMKQFINQSALFKLQMDLNQSKVLRMEAGVEELMKLNELRQVTTVFIKIGSMVNSDPKLMLATAQEVLFIVESVCQKYEGSLRQLHVDDKGAVILLFFGLPPLAHTNDATYGLKASLEIKDKFEKQFDSFSIGITTGAVSIGAVGNTHRTEYALMGDSINMAARIMCLAHAKKNVVCDEKTFRLSESDFIFDDLGIALVKGKDHPIAIFRPKKEKSAASKAKDKVDDAQVIGRKKEKMAIINALKSHQEGAGDRLMVVEAEGGQGLTKIADFAKKEALSMSYRVFNTMGSELDRRTQFYTIRQIFLDILYWFSGNKLADEDSNSQLQIWKASRMLRMDTSDTNGGNVPGINSTQSMPRRSSLAKFMKGANLTASTEILCVNTGTSRSLNRQSNANVTRVETLEDKITEIFICMKEDTVNIPILNILFPGHFVENDTTIQIKGSMRVKELSKIIFKIINFLATRSPIVLMISEGQWVDLSSWELLFEINLHCKELLLFLFSKPDTHYDSEETSTIYSTFKRIPGSNILILGGLTIEDTADLVLYLWDKNGSEGLTKVDKPLLEQIHKKTNGVPLIIDSLVQILKESGACGAKETGALFLSRKDFDLDQTITMGDSLTNLIVAQLDRIDRNFQLFLKVASVLGQRFRLADVMFFLSDTPGILEKLGYNAENPNLSQIMHLDKYAYLEHLDEDEDDMILAFKSDLVRRCIYSTMVVSQRQQLHLYVASYFETMLNDSNQSRLLVQIHEHYSLTGYKNTTKKLFYLAAVSHYYYGEKLMLEAIRHYNMLIEQEEEARRSPEFFEDKYDCNVRSNWHLELGLAYYSRAEFKQCEDHMRRALQISGYTFPTHDSIFNVFHLKRLFKGVISRNIVNSKETQDKIAPILAEIVAYASEKPPLEQKSSVERMDPRSKLSTPVLDNLDDVSIYKSVQSHSMLEKKNSMFRSALLILAHILFRQGKYMAHYFAVEMASKFSATLPHDSLYGRLRLMKAQVAWLERRDLVKTISLTLEGLKHNNSNDIDLTIRIIEKTSLLLFWVGEWSMSAAFANKLLHLGKTINKFGHCVNALRLKSFISFMGGSRIDTYASGKELYALAVTANCWEGKVVGAQFMMASMLTAALNMNEIEQMRTLMKKIWIQCPAILKADSYIALNQHAFLAMADARLSNGIRLDEFLHEINFTIEQMLNRVHIKVKTTSPFGSNRVWFSIIGMMSFCGTIMLVFESGKPITGEEKYQIVVLTTKFIRYLKESYEMRHFSCTKAIRHKLAALLYLFDSDFPNKSIKEWETAIQHCTPHMDILRGTLYLRLSKYGVESNVARYVSEAERLFTGLGAVYDLDSIKQGPEEA